MKSTIQRVLILDAVCERLEKLYGVRSGTEIQLFRKVWRRQWMPGNKVRPAITVVDNGAAGSNQDRNSDETKNRTLKFQLIIDLEVVMDRDDSPDLWTERVEKISLAIQNFDPKCGVLRMDYISDDPLEVMIPGAKAEAIWIIEFECEYFVEAGAFGKA